MSEVHSTPSSVTEDTIKDYYGKKLSCTADLKTSACVFKPGNLPPAFRDAIALVHEEVKEKYVMSLRLGLCL